MAPSQQPTLERERFHIKLLRCLRVSKCGASGCEIVPRDHALMTQRTPQRRRIVTRKCTLIEPRCAAQFPTLVQNRRQGDFVSKQARIVVAIDDFSPEDQSLSRP